MKIGLVPCTKSKLLSPAPAHLMYSPSPSFYRVFLAAKEACDEVLIVSAKYGLLHPFATISPYEMFMGSREDVSSITNQLIALKLKYRELEIFSYLSKEYSRIFPKTMEYKTMLHGGLYVRFNGLPKKPDSLKSKYFPHKKLLEWCWLNSGKSLNELKEFIRNNWSNHAQQLRNLMNSGFIHTHLNDATSSDLFFYKYEERKPSL